MGPKWVPNGSQMGPPLGQTFFEKVGFTAVLTSFSDCWHRILWGWLESRARSSKEMLVGAKTSSMILDPLPLLYVAMCRYMPLHVAMCRCVSLCVAICRYMSLCVDIRQYMSVYVHASELIFKKNAV